MRRCVMLTDEHFSYQEYIKVALGLSVLQLLFGYAKNATECGVRERL